MEKGTYDQETHKKGNHGLCIRPSTHIPHSRAQARRACRPKKGGGVRALGLAWEGSQSTFSGAVGYRGTVPCTPGRMGQRCPGSAVLVRAGPGEPGQGAWRAGSSQPEARLWRTPWGWEHNVELRQKQGALCLHHPHPRPFMPPPRPTSSPSPPLHLLVGGCGQGPGGHLAGPAGLEATHHQRPVWHHLWRKGSRVGLDGKP